MKLAFLKTSVGECACLFELRYFSLFAPLKHCAQAKKLSEKVCKVWEQLPSTFFSDKTPSLVRRLKVGVKGALWPLYVCCGNSLLELSFHFISFIYSSNLFLQSLADTILELEVPMCIIMIVDFVKIGSFVEVMTPFVSKL